MKKIYLLLCLITVISCKEKDKFDLEYVTSQFHENLKSLEKVEYNVQRIDTFPDGYVWNNKGTALLEKDSKDELFGFSFYGKRNDVEKANLYDNGKGFEIKKNENSFKLINPGGILGSPGGQMVVENIFYLDTVYKSAALIEEKDKFILTYTFEQDTVHEITDRVKIIELRKKDFFPTKITKRSKSLGNKSIYQYNLSNVKINQEVKKSISEIKNTISDFKFIQEKKAAPNPILNEEFPKINLPHLTDSNQNKELVKGKIILLDFWEVWCSPCIKSLPKIEELNKKYRENLEVIGIVTESKENALKLAENKKLTFLNLLGDQNIHKIYRVNSFPRYYLIDQNGIIKKEYFSFSNEIEKDIQNMIKK